MARYLFFPVNALWGYHFETDLEIMYELMAIGHEVFALVCDGALPTCYSNPAHLKQGCIKCVARRNAGFKKINLPKENIFKLKKSLGDFDQIPKKFSSQQELESFFVDGINLGKWVASTLMKDFEEHFVDVELHAAYINKFLRSSYLVVKNVVPLLKQLRIDNVCLLNGRLAEYAPIIEVCKKAGIDFFIHERAGVLERYAFVKNHNPQEIAPAGIEINQLWAAGGKDKIAIAEQWFIDRRNAVQQGWISHTTNQKRGKLPDRWDEKKRNIAIFNGALAEYAIFDDWRNTGGFFQNEIIESTAQTFLGMDQFHFYLRIHPNLKGAENTQMRELKVLGDKSYKNLTIIWPEDIVDTYELIERSEKVLTFGSTVGVEACFWGRPSILWGRATYESLDCIYKPESVEKIYQLIQQDLVSKPRLAALPYGYWEMRRGVEFKHFKPMSLSEGTFLGAKIVPEFTFKDRIHLKIDARLSSFFKKIKSIRQPKNF